MRELLVEQNQHWIGKTITSVQRKAFDTVVKYLPLKQIITISGIRRSGKSTLLKQTIQWLINNGTNPKNILFLNLEQPFFLEHKHNPDYLNTIFDEYKKIADPKGKIYFFMDEVQFFENWQIFVKSKYETSDIKFIITGSNSSLLSNDLNTLLSGRSLNIHLDTFDFSEFLIYKGIEYKDEIEKITQKISIKRALDEYLEWGGFFEVFHEKDPLVKKEILISYAKNIIHQDIIPRFHIKNREAIERLFFYCVSNPTSLLNYTNLAKTFSVSDKTIREYFSYLEDTFLLQRIDKFHYKMKEQIKSSKKVYVRDNGFLQIGSSFSPNSGKKMENLVCNAILSKQDSLYYLHDQYEVDFVTKDSLYQIAYTLDDQKTKKREIRSLQHFGEKYPEKKKQIITYGTEEKIEDIEILLLEDFLLNEIVIPPSNFL